jgi:Zn finger protein HypA/HybF involved in hydrogenase expression
MRVGRRRQYPFLSCPTCGRDMVRHHYDRFDCPGCDGRFREINGEMVAIKKREKKTVKVAIVKYLDADGYEELAG